MFLHSRVEFLGQVVRDVGHARFLLVGSAHAAFVLVCLFVVLLFCILAVALGGLQKQIKRSI